MQITLDNPQAGNTIEDYLISNDGSHISINRKKYHQSLIVTADHLIDGWPVHDVKTLSPHHFDPIFTLIDEHHLKLEVIIIGTGAQCIVLPPSLLAPLYNKNLAIECMDTGAACRTYSILRSESRSVLAAMIIPAQSL